ncbi:Protein of uncharacterised function DUF45 [Kingella potus]|uniref:Protein of uncharacterized function DUF45 n=1 Tax=Kingella potus TaxID=265175 RepID=A0A377R0Y0_9NEIS|nr:SprT family zinc-dependent metalloprotease [Kingella potus]STR00640.1 Protein of uncharacterised function DUF45 [Kingella potus]
MNEFTHYFSDGSPVRIVLKQTAKKNIILRPLAADALSVNAPKWLGRRRLEAWLAANGETLRQTLGRWTERPSENGADGLPEAIWFRGCRAAVAAQGGISRVLLAPECILLPEAAPAEQRRLLKTALRECAAQTLLPRLHGHAGRLNLHPAAAALSDAKTFWGVCRARTGIRLNWRLVLAPDFVADYVCVHELCHLPHPNHSAAFWELVGRHTPHTQAAKAWLKAHGRELFVLG